MGNKAPVAVTRGLEKKALSLKIDWLEGTFLDERMLTYHPQLTTQGKECHAYNGYTHGIRYADNRVEMRNPSRPDMGVHIRWSGEALEECPIDAREVLKFQFSAGMRITRLDLAIDAVGYGLRPQKATTEIRAGRIKTRARSFDRSDKIREKGYTQYVGRKASTIFLRVYDKAAELGIPGDHSRVELSLRGKRAVSASERVIQSEDFRPLVLGYCDFPHWRAWRTVLEDRYEKLPKQQKVGATEKWLLTICTRSLALFVVEHSGRDFLTEFMTQTQGWIDVFGQQSKMRQYVA